MSRMRTLTAAAAAAAVGIAVAAPAAADPVDALDSAVEVCVDRTLWEYGGAVDDSYFEAFTLYEATVYDTPGCETGYLQGDAFDDFFGIWLSQGEGMTYYGEPGERTDFVVDQSTAADGDIVVLGPVEPIYGLNVQVEHRFDAAGDLARVLVSYTNPTAAAITVGTGSDNGYGSDSSIEFLATSSGDAAVMTAGDSWAVTSDSGESDPVISAAWQLPGAAYNSSGLEVYGYHGSQDNFATTGDLTVAPGATVRLAYYVKIYGYESGEILGTEQATGKGLQATFVGSDIAAAEARAVSGVSEWASFSGRLTEGLPAGTVVLNWGTVGGAAPATPVVVAPAFTG